MTSRLALKSKAGRKDSKLQAAAGHDSKAKQSTKGWLTGWAQELDQSTDVLPEILQVGEPAAAAAAAELPLDSRFVLAFLHSGCLLSVYQASCSEVAVVQHTCQATAPAGQPQPVWEPVPVVRLEAAAVLAGSSVPDWSGGPCRPYLLLWTPAGQLRLVLVIPEQRCVTVIWDTLAPQAEVVAGLASISVGPCVLLPFTSGELWVAANYGPAPAGRDSQQRSARWCLHKLGFQGSSLLPCAVGPCWEAGWGIADGAARAERNTGPAQLCGSAGSPGGHAEAAPQGGASSTAPATPQLRYQLLVLTNIQATPPPAPQQQQQQQLAVVHIVLSAGGCPHCACRAHLLPVSAVAGGLQAISAVCLVPQPATLPGGSHAPVRIAVSTLSGSVHLLPPLPFSARSMEWETVAGASQDAVAQLGGLQDWPPQLDALCMAQRAAAVACSSNACDLGAAGDSAQLPAPADQLHFALEPGADKGFLVAVCSGAACVLSLPGLECVAQVGEGVVCCLVEGCQGLLCSLLCSTGDGAAQLADCAAGCGAAPLPIAILVKPTEQAHAPALDSSCGTGTHYAFLPVGQMSLGRRTSGVGQEEADGSTACTLAVLHRVVPQPAVGDCEGDDARRGLLKVVCSLQRRVDQGHVQAAHLQQASEQKRCMIAAGEAVLTQHCAETWGQGAALLTRSAEADAVTVPAAGSADAALPADAAASSSSAGWVGDSVQVAGMDVQRSSGSVGQWQLRVDVRWAADLLGHGRAACLVASSAAYPVSVSQHVAHMPNPANPVAGSCHPVSPHTPVQLQLSCTLTLPQLEEALACLPSSQELWVDVGIVLSGKQDGQAMAGPDAAMYVPAGRLALPLQPTNSSSGTGRRQQQQQQQQTGVSGPPQWLHRWQHRLDLVIKSEGVELYCLHASLQQMGAVRIPLHADGRGGSKGQHQTDYVLPVGGEGDALAGVITATWHSACFAELALQSDTTLLLHSLRRLLERSVQDAAQQAGGHVIVSPSVLTAQQAQAAVGAASALLGEVDACMEWVEALLRERLALESQLSRDKLPSNLSGVLQRQREGLEAALAADLALAGLGA